MNFGEVRPCGFPDMRAQPQRTDRQTERQITILCTTSVGEVISLR